MAVTAPDTLCAKSERLNTMTDMNIQNHLNDITTLATACQQAQPQPDNATLLAALAEVLPQYEFTLVLSRGGWYRIGGIYDAAGKQINDKLDEWLVDESGGDVLHLYNRYSEQGLMASRFDGKTHYFVAITGERPQDFVQLEVEEVVEMLDRPLFSHDELPDIVEELIDPVDSPRIADHPVGEPRYLFRRIIPIASYLDGFSEELDIKPPIQRFMNDWKHSSAGESETFCHHWVLSFREYTDGYGEPRFHAKPITTYSGEIPAIKEPIPRGAALANLIHGFDRQVGYPFAWYFFMLTHKQVSYEIAEAIHDDQMGAYDYLPVRDLKVLRDWYDRKYGV